MRGTELEQSVKISWDGSQAGYVCGEEGNPPGRGLQTWGVRGAPWAEGWGCQSKTARVKEMTVACSV